MAETRPPQEKLEHDVEEFDERIERLDSHIGDARTKAQSLSEQAGGTSEVEENAGDWEGEGGGPTRGDDDEDALDDPESADGGDDNDDE